MSNYRELINSGVDLRDQISSSTIMPSEQVLEISYPHQNYPVKHLSALKAIMGLTGAVKISEIGQHGPSVAANVTEANKDIDELRYYEVFFPRDAHVVAYFLHPYFPELTKATILETLRHTGVRENLRSMVLKDEQEVGKAPHEVRDPKSDPIAQALAAEKDWGFPYFGAIDTTPKNVNAIVRVALEDPDFLKTEYHGLDGRLRTVEEGLALNINWIRKRMELNEEGLVEGLAINPKHHANQTWPDSPISFHHADGSWARHHPDKNWGVAPVELQAEIYDALMGTAELYDRLTLAADGQRKSYLQAEQQDLQRRAQRLRRVVLNKFWVEDDKHYGGFFARGTDRDEHGNLYPLAVRSSDMGYLLDSRLLEGDDPEIIAKCEATIKNLFSAEMLCPNGFRTISSDSLLYGDERYHNGNSWPKVTYKIAVGLGKRHGYHGLAYEAKNRAWSLYDETMLLPEYGTGSSDPANRLVKRKVVVFDRTINPEPLLHYSLHQLFQPPQEIQAWTAAAILAIKYENGQRLFKQQDAPPTHALDPVKLELEQDILKTL